MGLIYQVLFEFLEQQKIFLTTNCRNRLIYLTSFSQHPSRFSQHFSQHNFQKRSTVWDAYGLSKRKFPYHYCVLAIFWTYTNTPEPNKNGEGEIMSDTKWTVVKQHDARWWEFWVIPPNIPPNTFKMLFKEHNYCLKYTFKIKRGTQDRWSSRVPFLMQKLRFPILIPFILKFFLR